jgi:hypothetical protein
MKNLKSEMLLALQSEKAHPQYEKELQLFGQFVGSWDFNWTGYSPEGKKQEVSGEWLFAWVLEGRAVQDVWIIPSRENRGKPGMPEGEYGTTVRFYDPENKNWKVTWIGPFRNRLKTFVAQQIDNEIVLESTNEPDFRIRWIFSDVKESIFHWRSVISHDDGLTWQLDQEMDVTRKPKK